MLFIKKIFSYKIRDKLNFNFSFKKLSNKVRIYLKQ